MSCLRNFNQNVEAKMTCLVWFFFILQLDNWRLFLKMVLIEVTLIFMSIYLSFKSSYPFLDSFNHLFWPNNTWSYTLNVVFWCTKFLKTVHNMVHHGFSYFKSLVISEYFLPTQWAELLPLVCSFCKTFMNFFFNIISENS